MSDPNCYPEIQKVRVRTLRNVLDSTTREEFEDVPGMPIMDYAPAWVHGQRGLRIMQNGILLDYEEARATPARAGDSLVFYIAPHGDPLTFFLIGMLISVVLGGINYAISALTAPSAPTLPEELEDSPTYGFDGLANTVRPGTSIPIIYGRHRVAGHIISQFTRPETGDVDRLGDPLAGEMHTLLALCTGPIESISSVRVNRNPVENYGSSVRKEFRLGGLYQQPIDGFNEVVDSRAKDAELLYGDQNAVTYTTVTEVDRFRVVLRFPGGLYAVGDKGQYSSRVVEIAVEHRLVGTSSWQAAALNKISQKTQGAFDRWIDSPALTRGQYEVRVTRRTDVDTSATGYSACTWLSLDEITDEILTYPGMALLSIKQLPTNQVSGQAPQYDCLVHGKRVRVYTDLTTYTEEWSDSPAWCCLDLMRNTFDGLGAWIGPYRIDIQSFIDWAAGCAVLVPRDSDGFLEPMFRLNIVLDGSMNAIEALNQICMTGRASLILKGDQWSVRMDKAEAPRQLFQMSRILKDSFQVRKIAKADLSNYLVGEFWNQDLDYEQDTLPLEDPTLSASDEQISKSVSLLGTTSASQGMRHLAYQMLSNRLNRREVEHDVSVEALNLEAGDVYLLAHDVPGWGFSGRLRDVDSTGTSLRLDRQVTVEAGKTYELTVIHPSNDVIDVVRVTTVPGTSDLIQVSGSWSIPPTVGVDYSFGEVSSSTVAYRCLSISATNNPMKRHIIGREYNPAIYEPDLTVLPLPSTTRLPDPRRIPGPVTNMRLAERTVYAEDGTMSIAIDIHYTLPVLAGVQAQAFWRAVTSAGPLWWEPVGPPTGVGYQSIERDVESPGATYEVSVVTVSSTGNRRHPDQGVRATITTTGTTRRPGNVSGFTADRTSTGLVFHWYSLNPLQNWDLAYYEVRDGASWDTATLVGRTTDTTLETVAYVKGTRTYLLKAFNTAGKDSPTPAAVVLQVDERIGENVVYTRTEDPAWTGSRESMILDDGNDYLVVDTLADQVAWRASPQVVGPLRSSQYPGGRGASFRTSGAYTTAPFELASTALRCLVATDIDVDQIDTSAYWDAVGVGDKTWDSDYGRSRSWSVAPDGRVEVSVEMRFSTTGIADGDFGQWQVRSQNVEVLARWAQARVTIVVRDPSFTAKLKRLRITFDVPDVVEGGVVSASASEVLAVTFSKSFNAEPRLAATVIGATAGDEVFVTSKTSTGFSIEVRNGGTRVARTVNYTAVGY